MAENQDEMTPSTYADKGYMYNYDNYPKYVDFEKYYFNLKPVVDFYYRIKEKPQPAALLDLGSGVGVESSIFRSNLPESHVYSLDISTVGAAKGKKEFDLDQIQADVNDPPFADKTFDAIHSKDVLVHVPDKDKFLEGLSRILKVNGVLLLVSSPQAWEGYVQYDWTPEEIIEIAKKYGLEIISQETIDMEQDDWYKNNNERIFMLFQKKK